MSSHPSEQEVKEYDFTKYKLSRKQAIRLHCLDCMGFQEAEVRKCSIKSCPLHPYRMSIAERVKLISYKKLKSNYVELDNRSDVESENKGSLKSSRNQGGDMMAPALEETGDKSE